MQRGTECAQSAHQAEVASEEEGEKGGSKGLAGGTPVVEREAMEGRIDWPLGIMLSLNGGKSFRYRLSRFRGWVWRRLSRFIWEFLRPM